MHCPYNNITQLDIKEHTGTNTILQIGEGLYILITNAKDELYENLSSSFEKTRNPLIDQVATYFHTIESHSDHPCPYTTPIKNTNMISILLQERVSGLREFASLFQNIIARFIEMQDFRIANGVGHNGKSLMTQQPISIDNMNVIFDKIDPNMVQIFCDELNHAYLTYRTPLIIKAGYMFVTVYPERSDTQVSNTKFSLRGEDTSEYFRTPIGSAPQLMVKRLGDVDIQFMHTPEAMKYFFEHYPHMKDQEIPKSDKFKIPGEEVAYGRKITGREYCRDYLSFKITQDKTFSESLIKDKSILFKDIYERLYEGYLRRLGAGKFSRLKDMYENNDPEIRKNAIGIITATVHKIHSENFLPYREELS